LLNISNRLDSATQHAKDSASKTTELRKLNRYWFLPTFTKTKDGKKKGKKGDKEDTEAYIQKQKREDEIRKGKLNAQKRVNNATNHGLGQSFPNSKMLLMGRVRDDSSKMMGSEFDDTKKYDLRGMSGIDNSVEDEIDTNL